MAADERWYFTREQLANTPSRKCGIDADKELSYRQQAANFIQDMGQRLVVSQLCINTAIVYMHRFYVFHSLTQFHRNAIAVAALFLAAKVEEQPRKLEHVIKMAYMCLHRDQAPPDSRSEQFLEQAQDLVFNENVLLQTLGFDVAIDHPHTHVVRCCQLVKGTASKDLAQTSYFMASNSLHLTTMCLQYKPTVVACFCIHLACKWSNWEIPQSTEGRQWFWYVDRTVSGDLLQELTDEFLHIFDKCPSRLKRKIMSISANQSPSIHHPSLPNSPFDAEPRRIQSPATLADGTAAAVVAHLGRPHHAVEGTAAAHSSRSHHAAEGTAGAPATAAAHSSRSHHVADTTSTSSTAVTAHSSRSHHTTDGAVAHSSRSHHTDNTGSAASATAAHSSRSHHTMDSAAAATAAAAHSSRSHHAQQEKQDEKKPVIAGLSTSRATAMDYREYREKKERERLEREKAAAAIGCHITDPNKHHSHHKPVSNANMPSKHQMPSVQKGTSLHHNHHHRPDIKVGQPVPQRHSASSQPNRDPSRQRLSREHNAGVASTSAGIAHSHSHANLDSSSSESATHRSDSSAVQDSVSSTHSSLQEKMSNNHSGHRLNALDSKHQAHDKRLYRGEDPRLKSAKYADMNRIENQRRKAEEQRCEEVRKLIEKPLPPPKQADIPYLINAQQKQQAHHAKYNQQQQDKGSSFTGDLKHATTISQNTLPQGTSPSASSSQKSALVKTQMYNQHTVQGVSQILKDTIKNGNSQSCLTTLNNMDATKSEKRSRSTVHEEFAERNSIDVQQGNLHTPPGKHRSLFSPEPPVIHRESHAQGARPKSKQKTPPSAATKLKERVSPFASSPTLQDSLSIKRLSSNDGAVSAHKRIRTSSISESEQPMKIKTEIKTEDTTSLEAMKMLGRVPDLIQPIRDNPSSSNGRNSSASSVINDLKPPELIKPFESDQPRFNTMSQHKGSSMNVNALTNGMDLNVIKQELPEPRAKRDLLEHYIKKEQSEDLLEHYIKKEPGVAEPTHSQTKPEYTSPMKSAQSISALLQETLAPMPSLLQGLQQSSQLPSQQVQQELQHQQQQHQLQSVQHSLMDHQLPVTTQCLSISSDNFTPIASTVDISVLSDNVSMTLPSVNNSMAEMAVPAASTVTTVPPVEEKRSEHHKSEKKKKKEKHKHKDKEKSKEKHKHKHKDKDKEKHREKKDKEKSEEMPAAAPIKITIPKDKLNLGTEASPTVVGGGPGSLDKNISPQSTGLKIKIPKERLKGTDNVPSSSPAQPPMVQAPLKIKIRTDGMSRSSAAAPPSLTSSSSNGSSHMQLSSESSVNETTSRKRERVELIGDSSGSSGLLSTKKQAMMIPPTGYGQGHRPGERQNGRHYNSGSNNKERHASGHHKSSSKLPQSQQSHAT